MKDIVVSFRRDLTINLGDYSNAKIGAPFPSAVCEEGEEPQEAYRKLKAMNLAAMREEILEVTSDSGQRIRSRALAMIGVDLELEAMAATMPMPSDDGDDFDSPNHEGDGENWEDDPGEATAEAVDDDTEPDDEEDAVEADESEKAV